MKLQRVAAAMPFAQLLGLAKRAEDDEDSKRARRAEEEDDDEGKKARRAEDENDEGDDEARARAEEDDEDAEEEENEDDKEDEDREDDDEDGKKSRKAKSKGKRAEEDDDGSDDGDEEGKKSKSARSAVRRDRARTAEIIAYGEKVGRSHQAAVAARYGVSVKVAKAILAAGDYDAPKSSGGASLADRMAAAGVPNVGADADAGAPPTMTKVAAAIVAAGAKARGETARK